MAVFPNEYCSHWWPILAIYPPHRPVSHTQSQILQSLGLENFTLVQSKRSFLLAGLRRLLEFLALHTMMGLRSEPR